jgi:hypothetical protein
MMQSAPQYELNDRVDSADCVPLLGLKLSVPCSSWGQNAATYFGEDFASKNTPAKITRVTGTTVRSLKFSLQFPEMQETFIDYKWPYIVEHLCDDLPWKFHRMIAEYAKKIPSELCQPSKKNKEAPPKPACPSPQSQLPPQKNCQKKTKKQLDRFRRQGGG